MEWSELRARTILAVVVAGVFVWMVRSLLVPITLGAVFALLLHPLAIRVERRLKRFHRFAPLLVTTAALVLVVLPLAAVAAQAVVSINGFLKDLDASDVTQMQSSMINKLRELGHAVGIPVSNIRTTSREIVQRAGASVTGFLSGILSTVPEMIIDSFLFVLALYFFLRDGRRLGAQAALLSPFSDEETKNLFTSVLSTVRGAIIGTVATAFVQGALTIIALEIFEVPGAFLFGLVAAFLSLLPLIGTTPVTFGAVLYLLSHGSAGAALGMGVAAVIIGVSDNVVRPFVQSHEARMHPLMALLGIFGGMAVMGPAGIFIGPVVSALVVWLLKLMTRKQRENKTALVLL